MINTQLIFFFCVEINKSVYCIVYFSQMGYGGRALELLQQYFEGKIPSLVEIDNIPQQDADTVDAEVDISFYMWCFALKWITFF